MLHCLKKQRLGSHQHQRTPKKIVIRKRERGIPDTKKCSLYHLNLLPPLPKQTRKAGIIIVCIGNLVFINFAFWVSQKCHELLMQPGRARQNEPHFISMHSLKHSTTVLVKITNQIFTTTSLTAPLALSAQKVWTVPSSVLQFPERRWW